MKKLSDLKLILRMGNSVWLSACSSSALLVPSSLEGIKQYTITGNNGYYIEKKLSLVRMRLDVLKKPGLIATIKRSFWNQIQQRKIDTTIGLCLLTVTSGMQGVIPGLSLKQTEPLFLAGPGSISSNLR